MGSRRILIPLLGAFLFVMLTTRCTDIKVEDTGNFFLGWSAVNITPETNVLIWGQRHARISEGGQELIEKTLELIYTLSGR